MDLTLKQASDLAHMNISTCRFYKDKYIQYFTTSGEGKKTKFEEKSTVEILLLIGKSYAEGLDQDQITEILDNRYGVNIVADIVPVENNNKIDATQQDVITAIKEAFREEVKALEDKIDLLASDARERDTQSQSRDAVLMDALRAIREKNEKKWWRWGK